MGKLHEAIALVNTGVTTLENMEGVDSEYWELLATGQDSEEAEDSGYISGYGAALQAVQRALVHYDFQPLQSYIEDCQYTMSERLDEIDAMRAAYELGSDA